MIPIGSLDKRITLQSVTQTSDGMGGYVDVWADVATVWAALWPVSAAEAVKAQANTMTATHRIVIRYRSGVSAAWRVKYGTRYFTIYSIINPSERNETLELLCKEVLS